MGSIAARQATAYSDIELALLIDDEQYGKWYINDEKTSPTTPFANIHQARCWLQSFFVLFELRIAALGEMQHQSRSLNAMVGSLKLGLRMDPSASFMQVDDDREEVLSLLIGSPSSIIASCVKVYMQGARDAKLRSLALSVLTKSRFLVEGGSIGGRDLLKKFQSLFLSTLIPGSYVRNIDMV